MLSLFCLSFLMRSQTKIDFSGLKFQQYDKLTNGTTSIQFISNTQAIFVMQGVLSLSGKSYRDECPCKCTVVGDKVTINCSCEDKELYPDPIKESFIYDTKKKILTSTVSRYTGGSAPTPDLSMKYIIWNQK